MECSNCGKKIPVWRTGFSYGNNTVCYDCHYQDRAMLKEKYGINSLEAGKREPQEHDIIWLTTETYLHDKEIDKRLGVISSEVVLGVNVFKDVFAAVRDVVGGKSRSTQNVLKELKTNCLDDLKKQAFEMNADAVIAVNMNYSEFTGHGRSMLFLVTTGTAVKFKSDDDGHLVSSDSS